MRHRILTGDCPVPACLAKQLPANAWQSQRAANLKWMKRQQWGLRRDWPQAVAKERQSNNIPALMRASAHSGRNASLSFGATAFSEEPV